MNPESLYEAVRGGGYEASLVTTYSIYFPFYEEIILPRLRASGCRHNVVMADARQCTRSMVDVSAVARRAGSDYTLIPMQSSGAFHPKILLLAGRSKAAVYVGSHNLTLAGYGYNRELTNLLAFDPRRDSSAASCARVAWRATKEWLGSAKTYLPAATSEAVLALAKHAQWLDEKDQKDPDPILLAQRSGGESLLEQLASYVPEQVRRIVVVGAFFDARLALLSALKARWPKAQIIVGVDPVSVSLPGEVLAKSEFLVRNVATLGDRSGYLHAKAMYFECGGLNDLFVCGSANPSAPAWMGGSKGNDEAVALWRGAAAVQAAKASGLDRVFQLPALGPEEVRSIVRKEPPGEPEGNTRAALIACETKAGFELPAGAVIRPKSCLGFGASGPGVDLSSGLKETAEHLLVAADPEARARMVRLVFTIRDGSTIDAFVHHIERINDLARSTQQVQLRAALQGLSADTTELHRLIVVMERAIFDDERAVASEISASTTSVAKEGDGDSTAQNPKPETLAVAVRDTRSAKKQRQRLLRSTDLGYLLDALISRLGVGLDSRSEGETVDALGRSEEERIGSDDEEPESTEGRGATADDQRLAKLCRAKVRTLVNRMCKKLGQDRPKPGVVIVWLVQLLAVVAVLRELRMIEKNRRWIGVRGGLADREDGFRLLQTVLRKFFGRGHELYSTVVAELGEEEFDELARLKGLLTWLAWDCGLVLDQRFGVSESRADIEKRLWSRAALLELAQMLSGDEVSRIEAKESVLKMVAAAKYQAAAAWLDGFERWSGDVDCALQAARCGLRGGPPIRLGEFAISPATTRPRLRIVSSIGHESVGLFDFGPETQEIAFRTGYVATPMLAK